MIDACAKHGDVDRAETWLQRMLYDGVQAEVVSYSAVIDACAKHGDVDEAESFLFRPFSRSRAPHRGGGASAKGLDRKGQAARGAALPKHTQKHTQKLPKKHANNIRDT